MVLGLAVLIAGCATPPANSPPHATTPTQVLDRCCTMAEAFAPELVALVDHKADRLLPFMHSFHLRDPYLAKQPAAWQAAMQVAKPLDVITVSAKFHLAGKSAKGVMTHAMVYLGSEDELRRTGLWSHPALRPWQDAITSGARFIEAIPPEVRLATPAQALGVDSIVVMRPKLGPKARARALSVLMGNVGTRFNPSFDLGREECLFCTELVALAMPGLSLPQRRVYGRQTIIPDDLVATALRGDGRMQVVTYIRGARGKWERVDDRALLIDLAKAWPEAPPGKPD